jgi:serine/threonine-protein kinase
MPVQSVRTWRQVLFAAIVLAFLGAAVGTAFGMVRVSSTDPSRVTQRGSQPAVTPSPSPSPSPSSGPSTQETTGPNDGGGETRTTDPVDCLVPKVIGSNEHYARKKLADTCGLTVDVKYTCTDQAEAGKVLNQMPAADSRVKRNSKATLTVRSDLVAVPNVVGQAKDYAKSTLEQAGFKVSVVSPSPQPGSTLTNKVASQNPAANSCQKAGSTVTITIGVERTGTTTPSPPADQVTTGRGSG